MRLAGRAAIITGAGQGQTSASAVVHIALTNPIGGQVVVARQRLRHEWRESAAVALDAADEQRLAERLGAIIGKKLVIKPKVDASIIGGFVARIDDKLMDASAASRLLALKHVMER